MLIEFSVSNFLSFNDRQTFSMGAGNVRLKQDHVSRSRKCSLLKFSAIYGANGAGKSNLVTAMKFAQRVIFDGLKSSDRSRYCRVHPENVDKNSTFEFKIKLDNKMYVYGFEALLSKESIRKEWLCEILATGESKNLFVREPLSEWKYNLGSILSRNASVKVFVDSMSSNDEMLFLTEMSRNKSGFYQNNEKLLFIFDIYKWFRETLAINYPESSASPTNFTNSNTLSVISQILSKMDLGVSDVKLVDGSFDELHRYLPAKAVDQFIEQYKKDVPEILKQCPDFDGGLILRGPKNFFILSYNKEIEDVQLKKFEFRHKNIDTIFGYHEESDGTRRLLDIIEVLISAKSGSNKVYVIDEIDLGLHPLLTRKFIEEYLNEIKDTDIQLIVTTHESKLMDLSLLRADEIRFVTKDERGVSTFGNLEKYNERFDKKVVKAYLNGEYNGIPKFDKSA